MGTTSVVCEVENENGERKENVEGGGGMEVLVVVVEIRVSRDSISEARAVVVAVRVLTSSGRQ